MRQNTGFSGRSGDVRGGISMFNYTCKHHFREQVAGRAIAPGLLRREIFTLVLAFRIASSADR